MRVGTRGNFGGVFETILQKHTRSAHVLGPCLELSLRTPSLSELCELVGRSLFSVAFAASAMASGAECPMFGQRKSQAKQRRWRVGGHW